MEMIEARGDNNNNNNSCEEVIITTTTSVDWRGRPSNPIKHGGMKAAAFVLGITYYSLSLLVDRTLQKYQVSRFVKK